MRSSIWQSAWCLNFRAPKVINFNTHRAHNSIISHVIKRKRSRDQSGISNIHEEECTRHSSVAVECVIPTNSQSTRECPCHANVAGHCHMEWAVAKGRDAASPTTALGTATVPASTTTILATTRWLLASPVVATETEVMDSSSNPVVLLYSINSVVFCSFVFLCCLSYFLSPPSCTVCVHRWWW